MGRRKEKEELIRSRQQRGKIAIAGTFVRLAEPASHPVAAVAAAARGANGECRAVIRAPEGGWR